jgi:hypothetical protein
MFLDLRAGNGNLLGSYWEADSQSLGEFLTRNFGESPSVVAASRLSQILEEAPHPKYFLSAKACQGILHRAERRGKKLPEILERALYAQIERMGRTA